MATRGRGRRRAAVGVARDGGAGRVEEQQQQQEEEPPRVCHRVTRFCPQCGGGVEPTFRFCPACGDRLPAPPPPRDAAGPPLQQAPSPAAAAGGVRSEPWPGLSSPAARTPPRPPCAAARRGSSSPRKARPGPAEPLPDGEELRDRGAGRWRLRRLLEQGGCGLLYEAQSASGTCPQKQRFSLKLVSFDMLGMSKTVRSTMNRTFSSELQRKTELDCLEYLQENEYVHGDITADNIYVNPADLTQVTLAGYYFAFRYCPEGKHVARREGSRTPHEGTVEFISHDSHKGAAPSRRSDLESLGYCLLKWLCGFLPWSEELDKVETVMEKKEMYKNDVTCLLRQCFSRQRSIPDALQSYLQQVMALEYEEKPNYEALRQLFKKPLQMLKASAYDSVDIMIVP
ncbi:inactive serine/threonine-protein kinase VRK3 isoform X2 [Gallus gallus]|uniref:inactive serine/threonine-protein kinase VRK3 isoform X2 n=1 Tax=Gallus gallus TaxID=9031 RepID=UPI000739B9B0|nr:inactive serine/threonine-protein kinase VRK3 isoform X2 [Gallus gallus]XP_040539618.1 inactive serine/threonine-protein kinase VRK3 isoform X2 [Gallus gallus]|eukprot:XP_015150240.1 inactive serine/threonine-protein kinase VRK3 isoform X2 [Gallus gallus]